MHLTKKMLAAMPTADEGDAIASAMYAKNPFCSHCTLVIERRDDATAILFNALGVWKLVHRACVAVAILSQSTRSLKAAPRIG